ncbi:chitinase 3 protein [Rutstroemia sp. NJR-2017a WRK4]|nr:chitinase 3 protein [Rutstroemia sp. NJR-2017a WRK4]
MRHLSSLLLLPLIQAIPLDSGSTTCLSSTEVYPRLATYVQTYHTETNKDVNLSLLPLLSADIRPTHIILSALHLMEEPGDINLNDFSPDHPMYDQLWMEVKILQEAGIKVMAMIGGAANGTWEYLSGTDEEVLTTILLWKNIADLQALKYYNPLLNNVILKHNLDGLDIDIEQAQDINTPLHLMQQLYMDLGPCFTITMAPVASALMSSRKDGLSGFSYQELDSLALRPDGRTPIVSFYNGQFYNGWGNANSTDSYDKIIQAGWDPSRVVMGVSANKDDANGWVPIKTLQKVIKDLMKKYPSFGGVVGWEYFDAGEDDGLKQPYLWMEDLRDAIKLTTKIALRKAGLPSNALAGFDYSSNDKKPSSSKNGANPDGESWANTFSNIEVPKSWKSWANPPPAIIEVTPAPVIGTRAPNAPKLMLPAAGGRPTVVVFLRHCGCPFAEKTFLELRRLANKHQTIRFIAISHSSRAATDRWVQQVGGAWDISVVVDEDREIYSNWGLGVSTTWHLLNPWTQWAMQKLGKEEGIWGREVDPSGNRWVVGGCWATDGMGTIKWGGVSKTADEIPDLVEACKSVGVGVS